MTGTGDNERSSDQAWQAIVDNFGERADLGDPPPAEPAPVRPASAPPPDVADPSPYDAEARFVPPEPPPLPRPEPRRAVAWAGVFGAPALVLVALVTQLSLPPVVGFLLIAWFVGGFLYLVATMSRNDRDPWDDGSRI